MQNISEERKVEDILNAGETFGSIKRSGSRFQINKAMPDSKEVYRVSTWLAKGVVVETVVLLDISNKKMITSLAQLINIFLLIIIVIPSSKMPPDYLIRSH